MTSGPSIVWLRDDLRLADNPALLAAVDRGNPVIVLFVLDDESPEIRPIGAARRWWLHGSLEKLGADVAKLGASLTLKRGPAERVVTELVAESGAEAVYWNRRYSAAREIDARLKSALRDDGIEAESFQANLIFEPWTITTGEGNPYRVFTPFWRACVERGAERQPFAAPTAIEGVETSSDSLDDWQLLPTNPDWAGGLRENCAPGEAAAMERLDGFIDDVLDDYDKRDQPGAIATSGLSPHLSFGEISPLQIWHRVRSIAKPNAVKFLSELGWREFNYSILYSFPALHTDNYRPAFDAFPWSEPDPTELEAWKKGRTGIPLVDAGMRELWHSGTMHNRIRMVTASFLIKNLLIDWRVGEAWFWDTLVDADEANNAANWQWVAGSGADAAPYFRVFNPVLQADKFDPKQRYIRKWVPEVDSPEYPEPIVDLKQSRKDALAAYEHMKRSAPAAE